MEFTWLGDKSRAVVFVCRWRGRRACSGRRSGGGGAHGSGGGSGAGGGGCSLQASTAVDGEDAQDDRW